MSKPSIELFKTFIKNHPTLIDEVKKGNWTWKELYEEWYVLGDEDEKWIPYRKLDDKEQAEGLIGIFSKVKNINLEEVQKNIVEMKGLIGTIQEFVRDLHPNKHQQSPNRYPPYYNAPYQSQSKNYNMERYY